MELTKLSRKSFASTGSTRTSKQSESKKRRSTSLTKNEPPQVELAVADDSTDVKQHGVEQSADDTSLQKSTPNPASPAVQSKTQSATSVRHDLPSPPVQSAAVTQPVDIPKTNARFNPRREETLVCVYHLANRCHFNRRCWNYHSPSALPYQWRWRKFNIIESPVDVQDIQLSLTISSGGGGSPMKVDEIQRRWRKSNQREHSWIDFNESANIEIESEFCDINNDFCRINVNRIGQQVCINFETMTFNGITISGKVMRCGTASLVSAGWRNQMKRFHTIWTWYWFNSERALWQEYAVPRSTGGVVSSVDLEDRFLTNVDVKFTFATRGMSGVQQIIVDFEQMTHLNVNSGKSIALRCRPKLYRANQETTQLNSNDYPSTWSMMQCSTDYDLVEVSNFGNTANEYEHVSNLFSRTMHDTRLKSIKRIQNYDRWDSFQVFTERMNRNRAKPVTIVQLFHGTRGKYVKAICQQGFDCRISGTSVGTKWGKGSYFARDASYSKDYTDSKEMFVVQVLVGDYTLGRNEYVRPPPKDPTKPMEDFYDSVVNDVYNPSIFVTFERDQSYPQYLLTY